MLEILHEQQEAQVVAIAPVPILFLIRSLDYGGAQRQLIELVRNLDKGRFDVTVATFYDGGELRADLERLPHVRIVSLHKGHRWDVLPFIWRLGRLVLQIKPQIMHGYMSVANELSLLYGKAVGAQTVWGLRVSDLDTTQYNWAVGLTFRTGAWLSRFADLIIVNSHAGLTHHVGHGYADRAMIVIPNGVDVHRFRPDPAAGKAMRRQWGIGDTELLVGQVARLDPMKGHTTFLEAAARLVGIRPNVRFVCVGDGDAAYKQTLRRKAHELGLTQRLIWAGAMTQTAAAYNALDLATLASSHGEGFANVVGEAMACGKPCVVTDVGDSARIVGDPAQVVPINEPTMLMQSWLRILDLPVEARKTLGQRARARIVQQFSVDQLAATTEHQLMDLLQ